MAACTPAALLMPTTPLLSMALASRSGGEDSRELAELQARQDWPGIARLARQRLAAIPGDEDWLIILGYAALQTKDYKTAIEALTAATERAPEEIDGWNLLGDALRLSGQPGRAVKVLERGATIGADSAVTRYLLGEAYRDEGRLERAKDAYRESLRLAPEFPLAWYGLAGVLARTGPRDEYEVALARLTKLDPVMADLLVREQSGGTTPKPAPAGR